MCAFASFILKVLTCKKNQNYSLLIESLPMQPKVIFNYKPTAVYSITRPLNSICEVILIYFILISKNNVKIITCLKSTVFISYESDVLLHCQEEVNNEKCKE